MNTLEIVILDDKMPRSLTCLVKLPGDRVRQVTAHWDIAASQFTPSVEQALSTLINEIIERHGVRPKRKNS